MCEASEIALNQKLSEIDSKVNDLITDRIPIIDRYSYQLR